MEFLKEKSDVGKVTMTIQKYDRLKKRVKPLIVLSPHKFTKKSERNFHFMYAGVCLMLFFSIMSFLVISASTKDYNDGFRDGYDTASKNIIDTFDDLTLKQSVSYFIKFKLEKIFWWFGLVIGISWVAHGVGFRIA